METKNLAIIGTVALVGIGVYHGYDGALIATGMMLVAGLAGFEWGLKKGKVTKK